MIARVFLRLALLSTLFGCSFQLDQNSTRAVFSLPKPVGIDRIEREYSWACLNVWGADGKWNSVPAEMYTNHDSFSVTFQVPGLWVGKKYSFRVLGFSSNPNPNHDSSYYCPEPSGTGGGDEIGYLADYQILNASDPVVIAQSNSTLQICGTDFTTNNCYSLPSGVKSALVRNSVTNENFRIIRVTNINNFDVWKEDGGLGRILRPSGVFNSIRDWQRKLTPFGEEDLSEQPYFTNIDLIQGRVCPKHVFMGKNNKTQTDWCLYYSTTAPNQILGSVGGPTPSVGTVAEDYLTSWNMAGTGNNADASWYEGNISNCKIKGMRLPALYETAIPSNIFSGITTHPQDPANATVEDSKPGVPLLASPMWTATAANLNANTYFALITAGPNVNFDQIQFSATAYVTCVMQ